MVDLKALKTAYDNAAATSREADVNWKEARAEYHKALAATFKWQPGTVFIYHGKQYIIRELGGWYNDAIIITASPAKKAEGFSLRTTEFYPSTHEHFETVSAVAPLADATP